MSRPHCLLRRSRGLGRPLAFGGAVRIGALIREPLGFRGLARFFGGASGLFGRALRLLRGPCRLRCALRFRGALRLKGAARLFLRRARLILRDACLLLCGLGLLGRGVGLAGRVGHGPGLTADVLEQLGEHTAERLRRERSRIRSRLLDRLLGRRGLGIATWTAEGPSASGQAPWPPPVVS